MPLYIMEWMMVDWKKSQEEAEEMTAGQMGASADMLAFEKNGAQGADWNCFRDFWNLIKRVVNRGRAR